MKNYIILLFRLMICWGWFIPGDAAAKPTKNTDHNLIVLLHGLANNADSFRIMKQKLEKAFPTATVVALTNVEGMLSATLPIKAQSEVSFQELVSKIDGIQNKSIVLIGHSQGGLRAYALLKQYETLLNVKGLVTLATPWEGAPGARVDAKMLTQHLTEAVLNDLRMLSLNLGYPADMLAKQLSLSVQQNQELLLLPGAQDLMVNSLFLNEIKKELPYEKVPIWMIGGVQNDFRALLSNKIRYKFKSLNDMYTFFTVGTNPLNNYAHDMKIPLYSQHAYTIIAKGKKNFKRIKVKNVFHTTHIWPKLMVPLGKDMLSHPDVLRKVIRCVKKAFAQK